MVTFNEQNRSLVTEKDFVLNESVDRLVSSPSGEASVLAAYSAASNTTVSILSLENETPSNVVSFPNTPSHVHSLSWESPDRCMVADVNGVHLYTSDGSVIASHNISNCSSACIVGEHPTVIAATDRSVQLWDIRTEESNSIYMKHVAAVSSIDANPNRSHVVSTGCQDGRIVLWDLRRTASHTEPAQIFNAHNHHVNNIQFNPLHDELLLSSGTDCSLKVWCCESSSSRAIDQVPSLIENPRPPLSPLRNPSIPYRGLAYSDKSAQILTSKEDRLVSQIDRHNDTIHDICWSHASPWIFASVGKDGLVMVNSIPKYLS